MRVGATHNCAWRVAACGGLYSLISTSILAEPQPDEPLAGNVVREAHAAAKQNLHSGVGRAVYTRLVRAFGTAKPKVAERTKARIPSAFSCAGFTKTHAVIESGEEPLLSVRRQWPKNGLSSRKRRRSMQIVLHCRPRSLAGGCGLRNAEDESVQSVWEGALLVRAIDVNRDRKAAKMQRRLVGGYGIMEQAGRDKALCG
jgi:hypothetical protein